MTFPEGFTTEQIAQRLQANGVCSADEFLKAVQTIDLSSYPFIPDANGRDYRLDGYLFPDTYEFDVDANVNSVIYKMLNRFNEVFKPAYYDMAGNLGYTVDDIIKLASIIEKEVKVPSENNGIGVFHNRLKSSDLTWHISSPVRPSDMHKRYIMKLWMETLQKNTKRFRIHTTHTLQRDFLRTDLQSWSCIH